MRNQELQLKRNNQTVSKFGGSILIDSHSFRKVAALMDQFPGRHIAIVSALGATNEAPKITDQLLSRECIAAMGRYRQIALELGCHATLQHINLLEGHLPNARSMDLVLSRGEWLSARLLSEYMGAEFIDGTELIRVANHDIHESTTRTIASRLSSTSDRVVIPGFYGENMSGRVETLTRNGSDVSAAVITGAIRATALKLWKDVDGVYSADPRLHADAELLPLLDFSFLHANPSQVIHPDAARFLRGTATEIHVGNISNLVMPGTRIVEHLPSRIKEAV